MPQFARMKKLDFYLKKSNHAFHPHLHRDWTRPLDTSKSASFSKGFATATHNPRVLCASRARGFDA